MRIAWTIAGIAVLVTALTVLWRAGSFRPAPTPDMANPGNVDQGRGLGGRGRAPDISGMTPEERFGRLFDRVSRAAEAGDTLTVQQFSPMALGAYAQLGQVNTDLRFDAALIQLAIGDYAAALALADTIVTQAPGHLFGYVIRGEVAERQNRIQDLNRSYGDFRQHYDAEIRAGRPEYAGHKPILDDFRKKAVRSPS